MRANTLQSGILINATSDVANFRALLNSITIQTPGNRRPTENYRRVIHAASLLAEAFHANLVSQDSNPRSSFAALRRWAAV
jgi:hypothetical protein